MNAGRLWRASMVGGLCVALVAAAVAVVQARHEARKLFVTLERLHGERDELNIEWNRLRLEQSSRVTHANVESLARDQLSMRNPSADEIVLVRP